MEQDWYEGEEIVLQTSSDSDEDITEFDIDEFFGTNTGEE